MFDRALVVARRAVLTSGAGLLMLAASRAQSGDCTPGWQPTFGEIPGIAGTVYASAVFDDGLGGGAALYIAGNFAIAGGVQANHIARFDGNGWSPLGIGIDGIVSALAVFDDGQGGGPALYAGGDFEIAGGALASGIARWDGVSWSDVGGGVSTGSGAGAVGALVVHDDGRGGGPALFA